MKALIVSTENRKTIIMTKDGQFISVKTKKHYKEGMEITHVNSNSKMLSMAAMFLILISVITFVIAYNIPSYTISMDINPSLEFYVNIFDRVIDVNGLNKDGEYILNEIDYNNKQLKELLIDVLKKVEELGYIEDEYVVVIGVDGSENQVLGLQDAFNEVMTNNILPLEKEDSEEEVKEVEIIIGKITEQMKASAQELEVAPGKILLITKANEQGATLDNEAAKFLSVQEIQKIRKVNTIISSNDNEQEQEDDNNEPKEKNEKALENSNKVIKKEIEKLEETANKLLEEIEKNDNEEKSELEEKHKVLTEQLNQVYSIVNEELLEEDSEKSDGYTEAKAKVEEKEAEKENNSDKEDKKEKEEKDKDKKVNPSENAKGKKN